MYWIIGILASISLLFFFWSLCYAGGQEDREREKFQRVCGNCKSYSIKASIGDNSLNETIGKCMNVKVFLMVRPSGLKCIPANKDYGLSQEQFRELINYISDCGELRFNGDFGCNFFEWRK